MIALEKIVAVLKSLAEDGVHDVEITPHGFAYSHFNSLLHPPKPYGLVIDPSVWPNKLAICILTSVKVSTKGVIPEWLLIGNSTSMTGGLRISSGGLVRFEAAHICRADDDNDPPPELLKQLVSEMILEFRSLEMLITTALMRDAGVSTKDADRFTRALFPYWRLLANESARGKGGKSWFLNLLYPKAKTKTQIDERL